MNYREKIAYARGLAAGMRFQPVTDEGRLLLAILDALDDLSQRFSELNDDVSDLLDDVQSMDIEDDGEVASFLDAMREVDHYLGRNNLRVIKSGESVYDDGGEDKFWDKEDGEDAETAGGDEDLRDPACPHCDIRIAITPEMLKAGSLVCPGCGQELALDVADCDGDDSGGCTGNCPGCKGDE